MDLGTVLAAGTVMAAIPIGLGILFAFMVLAPIVGFSLWTFKVVDRQVALGLAFSGLILFTLFMLMWALLTTDLPKIRFPDLSFGEEAVATVVPTALPSTETPRVLPGGRGE